MTTYGTTRDTHNETTIAIPSTGENDTLLTPKPFSLHTHIFRLSLLKHHLKTNISPKWADLILILCYAITGLLDSSAISIWGSFVSMQTGNTVYFALGLADPLSTTNNFKWARSGISISFFSLGSFVFSRFHRAFGQQRRWVLSVSFAVQMVCIIAAATIVVIEHDVIASPLGWSIVAPLALVAFQSSAQAVTSRALKLNSLTSVVLTSIYCDLFSDQDLFRFANVERNRRAAAPICLLVGAIGGALWAHSEVGMAGALWTAAVLKGIIVIAWLVWWVEDDTET